MLWLIVAVVILIAVGAAIRAAAKPDHFRVAGVSLGLDHSRTVPELLPRLSGTINGLAVRVDVPEPNNPAVRYRVFYPALGISLRLEKETTIGRTLGTLGSGDQQVGDKAFDDLAVHLEARLRNFGDQPLVRTLVRERLDQDDATAPSELGAEAITGDEVVHGMDPRGGLSRAGRGRS